MDKVFGFEQPEDSPGFLLWQTTITWQRSIKKALEPYNLSHAQFVILAISFWFHLQHQEVSQRLVIRQSKLDKMTVSKSLKKLVLEGYIKRKEDKHDTRAKSIQLTQKGQNKIAQLIPKIEKIDEQFFGILKKREHAQLICILNNLVTENNGEE